MIRIRKSRDRGHVNHGWLDTYHSFSFGDYYDSRHMGFRALRVINEDRIRAGEGFPMHSHRNMEIVTYILRGALEHRDSMGNSSVIRAGDVQRMSAGEGVTHSEYNSSRSDTVHLLQIWILTERNGIRPEYEQKKFPENDRLNRLRLIASRDGREGSVTIYQDVALHDAALESGKGLLYKVPPGRHAWIQVTGGGITINGEPLSAGDGAAVSAESPLRISAFEKTSFLLFDLA
jgi:redox-sensitive bicupin YhaK (pirin superfamily)